MYLMRADEIQCSQIIIVSHEKELRFCRSCD